MTDFIQVLGLPYLTCLLMIAILGYLGIHVLRREVIFIDIALAQMAAVGSIAAHLAFKAHGDSVLGYVCAFGFVMVASAFYSIVRAKIVQIPLEAVIGVTYAIAAAAALFLVGVSPGGHIHVQHMLAGSILWVTWQDVIWCVVVFATVAIALYLFRKPLGKMSESYDDAARGGMRVIWWDLLFYALLGLVITLAVRIAGVVLVFGFLIIPATISAIFATSIGKRLLIAWGTAAAAALAGLMFANSLDFSVGPSIGLFLGIALILAGTLAVLFAHSSKQVMG